MGDANLIRTPRDYSKPSNEGYMNTIELPEGNNVVPIQSDTIRVVQNGCSFHRLWFEDPNQHLKDFLKLVDSLDLDSANRKRTRLRLFQFSLRDQASIWLEGLLARSISTWEDRTTRFLAQFFLLEGPQNSTTISLCSNNTKENLSQKHGLVSRTYSKNSLIMASTFGSKSKSFMTMSLPPQNKPLTNRPAANSVIRAPMNLGKSLKTLPSMTIKVGTT
ncbi:zinc finger, CCHC-type containing protein [Tanacetum coccineum]